MLLINNIRFNSVKEQTGMTFFRSFPELYNANHQSVITSDRPPQAMPPLTERLRSFFQWRPIADSQPPDINNIN